MKLVEENMRKMLLDLELCEDFFAYDIKSISNNNKPRHVWWHQAENVCTVKETTEKASYGTGGDVVDRYLTTRQAQNI